MKQLKWHGDPRQCQRCGTTVNPYYWPRRLVVYCQVCVTELHDKDIYFSESRRHYDKECA
jgi:hypothetical protein